VSSGGSSELVLEVLEQYGRIAQGALRGYLLEYSEPGRQLYDLVADYPHRGGRALRPSLCIASARMFGGTLDSAVNSAVSLELMHNAFLVHDDIEDQSDYRRGRPTLHKLSGEPVAINVGDCLMAMSLRPLLANRDVLGPSLTLRVAEEAERMTRETVEGQAIELGWRRDNTFDLGDTDYLAMVLKKTCWYTTIYPIRLGALIGGRRDIQVERYVRLGFLIGAAFQIQDDLLNLTGDRRRYGKELDGDLWEGKRTLMLIHLMRCSATNEKGRLRRFLSRPRSRRKAADVRWIRRRMDAYGCIDYARQVAHGLAGAALHEFDEVLGGLPESRDKRFVRGLALWSLERR
jgi:geranylgeranyl diphosphate synthase type II